MVVALVGVLKAGGAYLPLDPDYPVQRLEFMVEAAGAAMVVAVTPEAARALGRPVVPVVELTDAAPQLASCSSTRPPPLASPDTLAYVMFTSGSTGQPKGVAVPHRAIARLFGEAGAAGELGVVGPGDVWCLFHSFAFDFSVWELWGALTSGGRVVVVDQDTARSPQALAALVRDEGVTVLSQVPSAFAGFTAATTEAEPGDRLRLVVLGGEAVSVPALAGWFARRDPSRPRMCNMYGITESGVHVTARLLGPDEAASSPIGRPIVNTSCFVLDQALQPVPVGVAGELYVGGVGVARGYVGRPELTAERFVADPFDPEGGRLYRTGDRVRWRADGDLEFLGRVDEQVKVRGFRVEPAEIEAALLSHPDVAETVVVGRADGARESRLVAYAAPVAGRQLPPVPTLRGWLGDRLPGFLVPQVFVELAELPRTVSGKVDRRGLPAPGPGRPELGVYRAPRGATEEVLAGIFTEVLGLERVGMDDNFFELGGDSIVSIQVVARARAAGLELAVRDVFAAQSVAELAALATTTEPGPVLDVGEVIGAVPLTGVQRWFLDRGLPEPGWFCQVMWLEPEAGLVVEVLKAAWEQVMARHHALRSRFVRGGEGWQARIVAVEEEPSWWQRIDLAAVRGELPEERLRAGVDGLCAGIDLGTGPMGGVVWFDLPDGGVRIAVAIHHLVVDVVSWSVLVEDWANAYTQLAQGIEAVDLGPAPLPWATWARAGAQAEQSDTAVAGEAAAVVPGLPGVGDPEADTVGAAARIELDVGPEDTEVLLREAPARLRASMQELLLAAIAHGITDWAESSRTRIDVEGHGRAPLDGLDGWEPTSTVGWFTTFAPLVIEPPRSAGALGALRATKEALRSRPQTGREPAAEVLFNYLGQLDPRTSRWGLLRPADEGGETAESPHHRRSHPLEITGTIQHGHLTLELTYPSARWVPTQAEQLARSIHAHLQELAAACTSDPRAAYVPSDFPLAHLDQPGLDHLTHVIAGPIDDIYPLTPTQAGLVFHNLLHPQAGHYIEQMVQDLHGAVDVAALRGAWELVAARHPTLRTSLHWAGLVEPHQVVHPRVRVPWVELDWADRPDPDKDSALRELLDQDRAQGFGVAEAPLLRLCLIHWGPDLHRLLVTHHHAILDGWSVPLVFGEVVDAYQALVRGGDPLLPARRPYRDFVAWLEAQDQDQAVEHWEGLLDGVDAPTPLQLGEPTGETGQATVDRCLSEELSTAVADLARQQRVTLNTVVRAAWSLLLGRYSSTDDVIFGATVAGRPVDLAGVEGIVGLFITTIPVRAGLYGDTRVTDLLAALQDQQLASAPHEHVPLVEIQTRTGLSPGQPLFETVVVYENYPNSGTTATSGGLTLEQTFVGERDNYAITLTVGWGPPLVFEISYDRSRFTAATVERLSKHLQTLLGAMAADPETRLSEIRLVDEAEQEELLGWSRGPALEPRGSGLLGAVAARAVEEPGAPAVIADGVELSYGELEARSSRLARYLHTRGVGPDVVVGVCLPRGPELVVAVLGVLKAGGAFLVLDPGYPPERLGVMADTAGAALVVASSDTAGLVGDRRVVDVADPGIAELPVAPVVRVAAESLAWVVFTSGSTGVPKGVGVGWGSVEGLLGAWVVAHGLGWGRRWLSVAPSSTDVFCGDLVRVLGTGGTFVLGSPSLGVGGPDFAAAVERWDIEALEVSPRGLRALVAGAPQGLELVVVASESFTGAEAEAAERVLGARVVVAFGLSEATVDSTWFGWRSAPVRLQARAPIGRPLPGVECLVVDGGFGLVPAGVPGELLIGGVGLARGYVGRPDLTAERFVANPWGPPGSRVYRSGDRCRWRGDGQLEFLGRLDDQLNVGGFRVEPAEIEAALGSHPDIDQAVVVGRDSDDGVTGLVAYITGELPPVGALRAWLGERLPAFMVPSVFVDLPELPRTAAGKVDRRALPAPGPQRPEVGLYRAPRNATEEILAEVFSEVLGVERVGADDDFFDLGGHSLLATRVTARLTAILGVEVGLQVLFETPTVAGLATALAAGEATAPVVPLARDKPLPLSSAQERLWFLAQLEPESAEYNVPGALLLRGHLNVDALRRALSEVVARHEVLRTRFLTDLGIPVQVIDPPEPMELPVMDLSGQEGEMARILGEIAARPFDLAQDRLLRVQLVRLAPDEHVLGVVLHHIVSDEWSSEILRRELSVLYAAFSAGEPNPLPPLPVQYADFAAWQSDHLSGERLETQLGYWRDALAGLVPLELPTDRPRPAVRSPAGGSVPVAFGPALSDRLRALARAQGASTFMVLLAGFQALLARWVGIDDVAVGTPVANRARPEVEGLVGFFVNTLVLRTDLSGDPSFTELIARVRETALGAYAHQDLPFERLVEDLAPDRDTSHHPLFQVMLGYETGPSDEDLDMGGLGCEGVDVDTGTTNFDLTLALSDTPDGLAGRIEFAAELFDTATVERLGGVLVELLSQAVNSPEARLSELGLVDAEEGDRLLGWAEGSVLEPGRLGLLGAVARRAVEAPWAPAAIADGVGLSYGELDARSNQLARFLRSRGVAPDAVVGVCLPRGAELVVAVLGVLKAGGAFLVLDPEHPPERLGVMADTANAVLVVASSETAGLVGERRVVDVADPGIAAELPVAPHVEVDPESLAWVVFTSGSTGVPKAVGVGWGSVEGLLAGWVSAHGLGWGWRWLSLAPASTDVFCGDVVRVLGTGSTLVLGSPSLGAGGPELAEAVQHWGIEALEVAPRGLRALVAGTPRGLELVVVASESFTGAEAEAAEVALGVRVIVGFGLSEATVDSTWFAWGSAPVVPAGRIPIGRPLPGAVCHVLDGSLGLVPAGVPGELFIGGAGLGRGYVGRPDLTAQRFVANPWGPPGSRVYRSGDRCRWRGDGVLEFLGRLDDQLNVGGFRVEPGEIEAVLGCHPDIDAAAVVARSDDDRVTGLIAYITGVPPPVVELRAWLARRLPGFMVPSGFVELPELPRTPAGKVDRWALPALSPQRPDIGTYRAPRNVTEEILAGVFADVLGLGRVGIDDDFFDLGGHSLLATRVIARITAILDVEIGLRLLFETPTVAGLATAITTTDTVAAVTPVPRDRPLPLSFAQERLWFLAQLEPDSAEYNVPGGLELRGDLDIDALQRALTEVVARHEVLRTRFDTDAGIPSQIIDPPQPLELPVVEIRDQKTDVAEILADAATRPFDLAHDRLVRAILVRLEPEHHVLGLVLHHIVSDEWSSHILRRELSVLYTAYTSGQPSPLPPPPVQYADYATWQRQYLSGERFDAQLDYWRQTLTGLTPLELPTDRPRPSQRSPAGGSVPVALGSELSDKLRALARGQGASTFMVVLAGFQALLARWADTDDVAVGTPVANRARPEVEDLVGFFVNTLVLRTDLSDDPTFTDLIARVRETALGAYAHQDLPFERLVQELAPDRDTSRHPLFQVMLGYETEPSDEDIEMGGLGCEGVDVDTGTTNFDLTLALSDAEDGLAGRIEFAAELFDPATVERLGRSLVELLSQAIADPEVPLSELGLVDATERAELFEWALGPFLERRGPEVLRAVAARAAEAPGASAVIADDADLSYGDLEPRSNQLAHHLRTRGVGPEAVVGICLPRGPDLIVAILGVLKAGGAFLVLDPEYPPERLGLMADTANAAVVVASSETAELLRGQAVVDIADPEIATAPPTAPHVEADPDTLAYVVFTSGSTGVPKGVAVSRRGFDNLVLDEIRAFGLGPDERVAQMASSSFDGSIWEMAMALGVGATVVMLDPLAGLGDALVRHRVSAASMTPTLLGTLEPEGLEAIGTLVCGAERLSNEAVRRWAPGRRMYNAYGPAEASVSVTLAQVDPTTPSDRPVPIGKPIANTSCFVLGRSLELVPVGVAGELFIGGTGVARGYVGRPELTAEQFVANPHGPPGSRLYRTGDRCRWSSTGDLEFLGRVDDQVKVRGFRVEPGEIESVLGSHPEVTEAAVLTQETDTGAQLVAYVCRRPGAPGPSPVDLRSFLHERLPSFAVPPSFVVLESFPRTPNGKLDRAALPLPEPAQRRPEVPYVAPEGPVEALVADVWKDILGVESVGALDDFFDLGGHSLLTVRVASAIEARIGVRLPVRLMFESPLLRDWAAAVDAELEQQLLMLSDEELDELVADDDPTGPP